MKALLKRLTKKLREADAGRDGTPDYEELARITIMEVRRSLKDACK